MLWLADGPRRTLGRLAETPTTRHLTTSGSGPSSSAHHATLGREVWTSDGTAAGTFPVTRFGPPGPFGQTGWLTPIDGRVYFVANDGSHGPELWSTAGQVEQPAAPHQRSGRQGRVLQPRQDPGAGSCSP